MTEYAQQYNGQDVVAVRAAHAGDPGYEQGSTDQIVATLADGSVVTIKSSQLTSHAPPPPTGGATLGATPGMRATTKKE